MFSLSFRTEGAALRRRFPDWHPFPRCVRSFRIGLASEIRALTIPQETDIGCRPFPLQEAKKEQNCSTKEQNHSEKEQNWSAGRRTDATGSPWPSACKRQLGRAERASGPGLRGRKILWACTQRHAFDRALFLQAMDANETPCFQHQSPIPGLRSRTGRHSPWSAGRWCRVPAG